MAECFADTVATRGPERSAQVNFGASLATGKYIYKVDSDFVLEPAVIEECVLLAEAGADAVVVHNSPDATVGWLSRIRKFEVDMYKYQLLFSSARFVLREAFFDLGGFAENITAGEDYDFQNRLNEAGYVTAFADAEALHLGEPQSLREALRKYYWYGKDFSAFQLANPVNSKRQLGYFRRVYFENWRRFLRHPFLGLGFIVYHTAKFSAGAMGMLRGDITRTCGCTT
jgi:GT2 family glycosyltransferase